MKSTSEVPPGTSYRAPAVLFRTSNHCRTVIARFEYSIVTAPGLADLGARPVPQERVNHSFGKTGSFLPVNADSA